MRTSKQRQLLAEALLIAEQKSAMLPTVDHLKALLAIGAECRDYSQQVAYIQRYPEYVNANNILVTINGIANEELVTA